MNFLMLVVVGLLIGGSAMAQEFREFEGIKTVDVVVENSVAGGCWKSPNSTKRFVEKELLSSGINVSDYKFDVTFSLKAIGYSRISSRGRHLGCIISYSALAWYLAIGEPPYSKRRVPFMVRLWSKEGLIVDPNHDLTNDLKPDRPCRAPRTNGTIC
jgi:hypothetical protein